mmetsp:Transcript_74632/g.155620  ORF Transcript_74632/g.155620 Transcript_74632/m.155620 type:complete len:206 (+) Transcript_74632:719-1336(+)
MPLNSSVDFSSAVWRFRSRTIFRPWSPSCLSKPILSMPVVEFEYACWASRIFWPRFPTSELANLSECIFPSGPMREHMAKDCDEYWPFPMFIIFMPPLLPPLLPRSSNCFMIDPKFPKGLPPKRSIAPPPNSAKGSRPPNIPPSNAESSEPRVDLLSPLFLDSRIAIVCRDGGTSLDVKCWRVGRGKTCSNSVRVRVARLCRGCC